MFSFPPRELLESNFLPLIVGFGWRVEALLIHGILHQVQNDRLSLTSWFRTPEVNTDVGGDPQSQHLFALAIDLGGTPRWLNYLSTNAAAFGLIASTSPDFVHLQLFPAGELARSGVIFPT